MFPQAGGAIHPGIYLVYVSIADMIGPGGPGWQGVPAKEHPAGAVLLTVLSVLRLRMRSG